MTTDVPSDSSIDMFYVLSQITIKIPLFELLRILEHRDKAIAWVGGVDEKVKHDYNENHIPKDSGQEKMKDKEPEVVMSQIP